MNDDKLKTLVEVATKRRTRKSRVIKFLAIVFFLVISYFTFNYYKFSTHPLVGGIAPRANSDATTDYTLIQIRKNYKNRDDNEYSELVVRLPTSATVYGIKDNRSLSFTANFDDLTYRNFEYSPRDSEGRRDQSLVDVSFSGNYVIDSSNGFAGLLNDHCDATGETVGGLEEFKPKPDEKYPSYCNGRGYVSWTDKAKKRYRAYIECTMFSEQKYPTCKYNFARGDDNIWGDYPSSRLAEAKDFFDRLDGFLRKVIVHEGRLYDRPFVWN
jgi:hypothetical protein